MAIEITGVPVDPALRARVAVAITEALRLARPSPTSAQVAFFDDDGPKGSPAIRCALTVHRPRRPALRVDHVDASLRAAFDAAFAALVRQLREDAKRARALRRRPKKYFVARRLLGEDTGLPT